MVVGAGEEEWYVVRMEKSTVDRESCRSPIWGSLGKAAPRGCDCRRRSIQPSISDQSIHY